MEKVLVEVYTIDELAPAIQQRLVKDYYFTFNFSDAQLEKNVFEVLQTVETDLKVKAKNIVKEYRNKTTAIAFQYYRDAEFRFFHDGTTFSKSYMVEK